MTWSPSSFQHGWQFPACSHPFFRTEKLTAESASPHLFWVIHSGILEKFIIPTSDCGPKHINPCTARSEAWAGTTCNKLWRSSPATLRHIPPVCNLNDETNPTGTQGPDPHHLGCNMSIVFPGKSSALWRSGDLPPAALAVQAMGLVIFQLCPASPAPPKASGRSDSDRTSLPLRWIQAAGVKLQLVLEITIKHPSTIAVAAVAASAFPKQLLFWVEIAPSNRWFTI